MSESSISETLWDLMEHDSDDINKIMAYMDNFTGMEVSSAISDALDAYVGCWDNDEDFAYHLLEEGGYLTDLPDIIANNLDLEAIAKEYMQGYFAIGSYYFTS